MERWIASRRGREAGKITMTGGGSRRIGKVVRRIERKGSRKRRRKREGW